MESFKDIQLGIITIRTNQRARHIIMRPQADGVLVTIPPTTSMQSLKDTLHIYREKLHKKQLSIKQSKDDSERFINLDFTIENDLVNIRLQEGNKNTFFCKSKPGETTITCPPNTQFNDSDLQTWLKGVIEKALKKQAAWILPNHLKALSTIHNLPFKQCKISTSKGRWGSCSAQKSINLSCYLLTLPPHLCEYVMLHELCHTLEMNHGPHFWSLLNSLTSGRAQELRNELKNYNTTI